TGIWLALTAQWRVMPVQAFQEGRRMLDAVGWAIILSQFLAALGFLFDKAGVGKMSCPGFSAPSGPKPKPIEE
ncbi:MAG TPA: DUF979 family protein, partial [Bryobacteraceae bacterium]|nr:DUF979 family protein [Bryobacteraceae bacterium]